jgi:hypothetical protein
MDDHIGMLVGPLGQIKNSTVNMWLLNTDKPQNATGRVNIFSSNGL